MVIAIVPFTSQVSIFFFKSAMLHTPTFATGLKILLKNLTYKKSEIQLNIKDSFYRVLKAR